MFNVISHKGKANKKKTQCETPFIPTDDESKRIIPTDDESKRMITKVANDVEKLDPSNADPSNAAGQNIKGCSPLKNNLAVAQKS